MTSTAAFSVVFSSLALFGGYVAVTYLIAGVRVAAYWVAFQFAGEEHPDFLDRLADSMEER